MAGIWVVVRHELAGGLSGIKTVWGTPIWQSSRPEAGSYSWFFLLIPGDVIVATEGWSGRRLRLIVWGRKVSHEVILIGMGDST